MADLGGGAMRRGCCNEMGPMRVHDWAARRASSGTPSQPALQEPHSSSSHGQSVKPSGREPRCVLGFSVQTVSSSPGGCYHRMVREGRGNSGWAAPRWFSPLRAPHNQQQELGMRGWRAGEGEDSIPTRPELGGPVAPTEESAHNR